MIFLVCECGPNAYHYYYNDRCICECEKDFYGNPNSECFEEPKTFTWINPDGTEELEFFQEETPLHSKCQLFVYFYYYYFFYNFLFTFFQSLLMMAT